MNLPDLIVKTNTPARQALRILDKIGLDTTVLIVIDENKKVLGTVTDGDIRRGLLKDMGIDDPVDCFMKKNFHSLFKEEFTKENIKALKKLKIRFAPIVDRNGILQKILDIDSLKSFLPVDALIMAGGKGKRLLPLTENTPKPLLTINHKPIIEHNIDRIIQYGINNFNISVGYLGQQIIDYLGNGNSRNVKINYIKEKSPLGTLGALSKIKNLTHDFILIMNSDLLTNIDFEMFFEKFISTNADMAIASTPYEVTIPYATLELENDTDVVNFKEKPKYTYFSNAGIYLIKKKLIKYVPKNQRFDTTDLMRILIKKRMKLVTVPIFGYWLDIGRVEDLEKAREDIKHINLS